MTEAEAQHWIAERWPTAMGQLQHLAAMVAGGSVKQNLVAKESLMQLWNRHMADSAQLTIFAPSTDRLWIDVGTGAGFPGLVCALCRPEPFLLVEPRRLRADFIQRAVIELGLSDRVTVQASRVIAVKETAGTLTGRALASISKIMDMCAHLVDNRTTMILPRGTIDYSDLEVARRHRSFVFHVEQSVTNEQAAIAVISDIKQQ